MVYSRFMTTTTPASRRTIAAGTLFSILIVAPMPALAQSGKPVPGDVQTYKDWAIGCDNGGACEAVSLLPEGQFPDDPVIHLSIARGAGPVAQPEVRLRGVQDIKGPFVVQVDGRTLATLTSADDEVAIEGPQGAALALAIARGSKLEVRQGNKVLGTPSLSGSAAALRYMDAKQGRAGTVTAMVATGPLRARTVKPAPPLPLVRRALVPEAGKIAPLWVDERATANKVSGCNDEFDREREPEQFPLSKSQTLVLVPCGAGAYNFSSGVLIATGAPGRRSFTVARFDLTPGWGEDNDLPVVVNADWNAKTSMLTSYAKGRGIGDCGASQSWVWDGTMFRLTDAASMGECRGSWHWITTWRAKVVP